jgi:oligopeptide transport system substrate-binding protein
VKGKKILAALLAVSLIGGTGLVGCGNKGNNPNEGKNVENNKKENDKKDEEKKDEEKKDEAKGDEIDKEQYVNCFIAAEPKSLDPSRSSDLYSNQVDTHIIDGLTRIEQVDGNDKIVPGIAESWDIEDEGKTYIFHLRDAKWADGVPVKAEDFVYGLKRTLDPNTGSTYAWIIKDVVKGGAEFNNGDGDADGVGITAIDEKTLKVELTAPVAYFLDLTYFRVLLPQRKDIVEKYGDSFGSEAEHMMSNGAFILKEWVHDNKFVFEKNPDYWNADAVKLNKLTMNIVKDEGARMNMMLNGQVDVGVATKAEWISKFDDSGNFDYSSRAKPSAVYEIFNQKNKYFKNDKIRKAFIVALDRDAINNTLYKGKVISAKSWCPPAVQIGGEDFREKSGKEWITILKDENPDAKALLIEGLKEEGLDADPANMEVTMLQSGTDSTSREFAEFEQQRLQDVLGIKVKIDYYEWAIFQQKQDAYEFDFCGQGWSGDYNDPMTFFEMFASYANMTSTGWKNDEYDDLMRKTTQTSDNEERFKMFERAEEILIYEDAVISPWIYRKSSSYTREYVKNVISPLFGTTDFTKAYTVGRE